MSSPYVRLFVSWIFCVFIQATSTSKIVRRHLTKHKLEVKLQNSEHFPDILPVVLKGPDGRIVTFNFTKKDINYDVPVYIRSKNKNSVVRMETHPIKDVAFYEDRTYSASITLHCQDYGESPHVLKSCNIRSMSGFFHLDGHKHVIEAEKSDLKRVKFMASQKPRNQFVQNHRVYKLARHNHGCSVKNRFKWPIRNITIETDRYRRSKQNYIIEVMAVITHDGPINDEEIKKQKIYYTHVFYGVNLLYNQIELNDATYGVNLIGFIVEPDSTDLYKFPQESKDYLNGSLSLDVLAKKNKTTPADHYVLFSKHDLSDSPSTVGLANVAAMCKPESVSLCRVLRSFEEIHVVAHEIGHSLGSYHDGESNSCDPNEAHIMTAVSVSNMAKDQILNSYKFSSCSIQAISQYVAGLNSNCLLKTEKSPIIPQEPTGQLFSIKEQCQTSPNSAGVCSRVYNRSNSNICQRLPCLKGIDICKFIAPAYKTTCGNKKWCMFGECVYDANAPSADENCLFGDNENLRIFIKLTEGTIIPKNCNEVLRYLPNFCSHSASINCCSTCKKLKGSDNNSNSSSSSSSTMMPWSTSQLMTELWSSNSWSSVSSITTKTSTLTLFTTAANVAAASFKRLFLPVVLLILRLSH